MQKYAPMKISHYTVLGLVNVKIHVAKVFNSSFTRYRYMYIQKGMSLVATCKSTARVSFDCNLHSLYQKQPPHRGLGMWHDIIFNDVIVSSCSSDDPSSRITGVWVCADALCLPDIQPLCDHSL